MPQQLISIGTVKDYLGLPSTFTTEDGFLESLCTRVTATALRIIDRQIMQQNYTQYLSGNGDQILILKQRPLWAQIQSGTTTLNSPTVTGLASTGKLTQGMPCVPTNTSYNTNAPLFPPQTYILSIDSTSQVTLNGNAAASGSQTLIFGIDIYEDEQGYAGSGTGAYDSNTQLIYGSDYAMYNPDTTSVIAPYQVAPITCESGMLARITGTWWRPWTNSGALAPSRGIGSGNILANYTAGYATLPADIEQACLFVIAKIKASRPLGMPLKSEGYEEYHYEASLPKEGGLGIFDGWAGQLLLKYKNMAV